MSQQKAGGKTNKTSGLNQTMKTRNQTTYTLLLNLCR